MKIANTNITTFTYRHINKLKDVTFGDPLELDIDPADATDTGIFGEILVNHEMCNYYNALCEMTDDEDSCKAEASGVNQCNE